MWIKKNNKTTIIFIDPKGLEHSKGLEDEKIQFAREIKEKYIENHVLFLEDKDWPKYIFEKI